MHNIYELKELSYLTLSESRWLSAAQRDGAVKSVAPNHRQLQFITKYATSRQNPIATMDQVLSTVWADNPKHHRTIIRQQLEFWFDLYYPHDTDSVITLVLHEYSDQVKQMYIPSQHTRLLSEAVQLHTSTLINVWGCLFPCHNRDAIQNSLSIGKDKVSLLNNADLSVHDVSRFAQDNNLIGLDYLRFIGFE